MLRFSKFIGQETLLADLRAALAQNRLGHAYLFVGPEGVGRRTLAHIFAQAILCEDPNDKPCGRCRACVLAGAGTHPDLQIIEPDGASIRIEQMRTVRANVSYKALLGEHRVYLIDGIERLSEAAANAFLLTLEDPPHGIVFLAWALAGEPLLPTIVSRCQVRHLQAVPLEILAKALVERGVDDRRAREIAGLCSGLPGAALKMMGEGGGSPEGQDELFAPILLTADLPELFRATDAWSRKDREDIGRSLKLLDRSLQSALVARFKSGGSAIDSWGDFKSEALWRLWKRTAQAADHLQANANARLLLDLLALAFYRERQQTALG